MWHAMWRHGGEHLQKKTDIILSSSFCSFLSLSLAASPLAPCRHAMAVGRAPRGSSPPRHPPSPSLVSHPAREEGAPGGRARRGNGWRQGSQPAREEGAPGGGSARPLEEGKAGIAVVVVLRAVRGGRVTVPRARRRVACLPPSRGPVAAPPPAPPGELHSHGARLAMAAAHRRRRVPPCGASAAQSRRHPEGPSPRRPYSARRAPRSRRAPSHGVRRRRWVSPCTAPREEGSACAARSRAVDPPWPLSSRALEPSRVASPPLNHAGPAARPRHRRFAPPRGGGAAGSGGAAAASSGG
ncbi:hypothetical protein PVAP13_5NG472300 [Panicum virgatum]|uniref:Uncharacterized protein n=1 Tax=Panicum virgatum TaxID=38727 RepID=A0A8T0S431_PANVG|nr:hypothetical protein PVAP13_5NG472300 [Panicum virgatum]